MLFVSQPMSPFPLEVHFVALKQPYQRVLYDEPISYFAFFHVVTVYLITKND